MLYTTTTIYQLNKLLACATNEKFMLEAVSGRSLILVQNSIHIFRNADWDACEQLNITYLRQSQTLAFLNVIQPSETSSRISICDLTCGALSLYCRPDKV